MLCHLPVPYPDELLYSVITRYMSRIGALSVRGTTESIFGRKIMPCADLPSSLEAVSIRTWPVWGMTGEQIAEQLTLFPYYARYSPHHRVTQCLTTMLSDRGTGVHCRIGVNATRFKIPKLLRFCPSCRAADIDRFGETYWHRAHQLAGVLVCPEHGDLLVESNSRLNPNSFTGYFVDATWSTANLTSVSDFRLTQSEVANALKIACRCREMLLGPILLWPQEDMPWLYRHAAIERGFSQGFNLSMAKFEDAIIAFYGQSFLSRLGYKQQGNRSEWESNVFRPSCYRRAISPVEHALVQIFLESRPIEDSKRIPIGLGPWKCPNPYGIHEEAFPIKRGTIRIHPSREFVASAKCSCGFRFTFSRTDDADPNLPVVRRTYGLGPTWKAEAERLKRSGLTTRAIARKMDIADDTVQRLLGETKPVTKIHPTQIEEWRREWLRLLEHVPDRKYVLARKQNGKLYARLRRWDRDWLFAQREVKNTIHLPNNRADWKQRDKEWSELLKATAQKVKALGPPRRVTAQAIINASGLPIERTTLMRRLPLCQIVLRESSESLDDARERRLRAAVSRARDMRLPRAEWALRRLSGLSGKKLSPSLNAVLQELLSDPGMCADSIVCGRKDLFVPARQQ